MKLVALMRATLNPPATVIASNVPGARAAKNRQATNAVSAPAAIMKPPITSNT